MVLVVDLEPKIFVTSERMVKVELKPAINSHYYTSVECAREQFH